MADAMSAGAREDVLPATIPHDLGEAHDGPFAADPYGQIGCTETLIVWALALAIWTGIAMMVLS